LEGHVKGERLTVGAGWGSPAELAVRGRGVVTGDVEGGPGREVGVGYEDGVVIRVSKLKVEALVTAWTEVSGIGSGVRRVIRVGGESAVDSAGLRGRARAVDNSYLHVADVLPDKGGASVFPDQKADGADGGGVGGQADGAIGSVYDRGCGSGQGVSPTASSRAAAVVSDGRVEVCGTAVGEGHFQSVSIGVAHARVEAEGLPITGQGRRGIGKGRGIVAGGRLRVEASKDVKVLVVGAGGDAGVATAVRQGENPVTTVLELNGAFVVMLFPPIRCAGVSAKALLAWAGRGDVCDADAIERDGLIHITGAGLVADRDGAGLAYARAVPINPHPDAVGGGISTGVDALDYDFAAHKMGSLQTAHQQAKPE